MDLHPGLLFKIRKDYADWFENPEAREVLVKRLCDLGPNPAYRQWLGRWKACFPEGGAGGDGMAASTLEMDVLGRLVTGLGDRGVFEWGLRLHHTYGMPLIPGSSLKGVVASLAQSLRDKAVAVGQDDGPMRDMQEALFGSTEAAGMVVFHDAWWVPTQSCPTPFVRDVMTPHHLAYGSRDDRPAADWDDPTPVSFVAVRGRFFFAVEASDKDLAGLAMQLLQRALTVHGVGAKTRAGYGSFHG